MDKLRALKYFLKVADTLSFTEAGKAFDVPASSISRRIAELEASVGAELLHRTTRTVSLTESGELYLEHVSLGITQLAAAEELLKEQTSQPGGTLRISCTQSYGRLKLMPVLQEFNDIYPGILLDLDFSDELQNLGGDQFDIVIRAGPKPEDRVVARKLDRNRFILAASPAYLASRGTPETFRDLAGHSALMYRGSKSVLKWLCFDGQDWTEPRISPAFISNDVAGLIDMACRHRGIVLLPEWSLQQHLDQGELIYIELDNPLSVARSEVGIFMLYQQSRYLSPKTRLAVEFIYDRLAQ